MVVAEEFSDEEAGPVGEDGVVCGEAVSRGGGGGDEEDAAGAEVEEDDGAVAAGEGCEGAVEGRVEEVEVAEEGEAEERGGWEVLEFVEEMLGEEEDGYYEREVDKNKITICIHLFTSQ